MPTQLNREQARSFVGYCVDDALNQRQVSEIPNPDTNVVYVGWACGFEPMFVAVWSYLPNVKLDYCDAEQLATDLLREKGWFADGPTEANYFA